MYEVSKSGLWDLGGYFATGMEEKVGRFGVLRRNPQFLHALLPQKRRHLMPP